MTATASSSSSAAAVLNPMNPSVATTSTRSRHSRGRAASHRENACYERPSTMSNSRPSRLLDMIEGTGPSRLLDS